MSKILELIEDSNGKLSTPSCIIWVGVLGILGVMIVDACNGNPPDAAIVGIFAGLVGGVYGIKKSFDSSEVKATINAGKPTPDINVGNIENAETLTKEGEVTLKSDGKKPYKKHLRRLRK